MGEKLEGKVLSIFREDGVFVPLNWKVRGKVRGKIIPVGEAVFPDEEEEYVFRAKVWHLREGGVLELSSPFFLPKNKTVIGKRHVFIPRELAVENNILQGEVVFPPSVSSEQEKVRAIVKLLEDGVPPEGVSLQLGRFLRIEEVDEDALFPEQGEDYPKPEQPPPQEILDFVERNGAELVPLKWKRKAIKDGGGRGSRNGRHPLPQGRNGQNLRI